jgi:hypothetical protein
LLPRSEVMSGPFPSGQSADHPPGAVGSQLA